MTPRGFRRGRSLELLCLAVAFFISACSSPTAPPPPSLRITSISPVLGSTTGGTMVTIIGTEFASDATVTIGGVLATNVVLQGSTSLTAVLGPRVAGTVDVVVTSGGHTATLTQGFAFVAPSGANLPPVITGIRSTGPYPGQPSGFGDLDQTVTLIADVTDAETPANSLSYQWTGPGTFSGSMGTVTWHLPAALSPIPSLVVATVTATETYTEGKITYTNVSDPKTFVMTVHDSQTEILDIGQDFLTLFSQSNVSTNDVLHNFSTTCDGGTGRAQEKGDVDFNRATYIQDFSAFRISRRGPATIAFQSVCVLPDGRVQNHVDACSSFAVHWEVIKRSSGAREITNGVDYVSAVLESNRWRICHSSFIPSQGFPTLGMR